MYAKAHPFGYIKQKTNKSKRVQCRNIQCTRVQTIYIGNGQVKTIFHSDISHKSGYTLAESYWNSVLNSPNYGVFMNKFHKKDKNLTD